MPVDATSSHSSGRYAQSDPARALPRGVGAWLRALANVPVCSWVSIPLSATIGCGVGSLVAAVARVFNPAASLHEGAMMGVALASGYMAQYACADQQEARLQFLRGIPELARCMAEGNIASANPEAVDRLYDYVKGGLDDLLQMFHDYGSLSATEIPSEMEQVLIRFYLLHCPTCPAYSALLRYRAEHDNGPARWTCFFAAMDGAIGRALDHAIFTLRQRPEDVFNRRGMVFVQFDLDGKCTHVGAHTRRVPSRRTGSLVFPRTEALPTAALARVAAPEHSAWNLAGWDRPEFIESARQNRPAPLLRRAANRATPLPTPPNRLKVVRSDEVRRRLKQCPEALPSIMKIEKDLQTGRSVRGKQIERGGTKYHVRDVTVPGDGGRGRWRLLYQRAGDQYKLCDIVDYH